MSRLRKKIAIFVPVPIQPALWGLWSRGRRALRNPYVGFMVGTLILTCFLSLFGGLAPLILHPLEWPLLLYLYWLFYGAIRDGRWAAWIAAAPLALGYLFHDAYFMALGAVFRLADFEEVPELLQILAPLEAVLILALLLAPLLLVLSQIATRRLSRTALAVLPAVLLVASTRAVPEPFLAVFAVVGREVTWSDASTVERNGRLMTLLLREAQRNAALERSASHRDPVAYAAQARARAAAVQAHMRPRPVHLIVLESLLDPTQFTGVRFSRDPRHPDYVALFGDRVGMSISPVFGSRTAEAEFEVLCGVPGFQEIASVEFNAFTGAPARCLPDILGQAGYHTEASNGFRPNFFNAIKGYRGTGFADIYFPREYASRRDTYLTVADIVGDETYLFDGDLFRQAREHQARTATDRPRLHYMLTIYGHHPYRIDKAVRPEVVTITAGPGDAELTRITNQFYYRTEAIAHHVRALIEREPEGLIILIGDHLPLLGGGADRYQQLGYLGDIPDNIHHTRLLVVVDGKPVTFPVLHHYDIPALVYDYLTDGWYCRAHPCNLAGEVVPREAYRPEYLRLMAHAAADDHP